MSEHDESAARPTPDDLARAFSVLAVETDDETVVYVGRPTVDVRALEREVWPLFRKRGYEVRLQRDYDGRVPSDAVALVAEPRSTEEGIPWRNVVLFVLTVASTLFAGAFYWYQLPVFEQPLSALAAWPFSAAIMGVLGVHEFGHYVMSRYHDVDASLPYFIPLPLFVGSMGAVIRMRERMPNRKALFDIGAAGPLAGLVATIAVTLVGLQLDPLPVQEAAASSQNGARVVFNNPPLLWLLAEASGTAGKLEAGLVHPVVFGGWVGMLVTVLNLLPVGQLDGGHIVRAIAGRRQETLAAAVPGALFALAGYLYFVRGGLDSVGIWAMWGLFTTGLAYAGPATPVIEDTLDRRRVAVGVVTLVLGALCFTPIPVEVVGP
ncbi:site-2 protease family protein [Salinibaculum rarum]|uniref:site-2 protease family protein n=1 Tax=Salinibaculum rarum TaxID=3058903 RepID=UPI00265F0D8A|nr:site-2 protease family protein [Salinibaculum sp. KK48]